MIIEGRKNGKTTETAAVEIDMLIDDKEGSPQIYNIFINYFFLLSKNITFARKFVFLP